MSQKFYRPLQSRPFRRTLINGPLSFQADYLPNNEKYVGNNHFGLFWSLILFSEYRIRPAIEINGKCTEHVVSGLRDFTMHFFGLLRRQYYWLIKETPRSVIGSDFKLQFSNLPARNVQIVTDKYPALLYRQIRHWGDYRRNIIITGMIRKEFCVTKP